MGFSVKTCYLAFSLFVLFPISPSCINTVWPKCCSCVHPEFALSGSNGPILWDRAYTHFTSSVLNTFMIPVTHPVKNKWEPTYLCYPESPLTPSASGPIAHSFVLDPSQREAAFSLTTMGSVWTCSSYCWKSLMHMLCRREPKCGWFFFFVLFPYLYIPHTRPMYPQMHTGSFKEKQIRCFSWLTCIPCEQKVAPRPYCPVGIFSKLKGLLMLFCSVYHLFNAPRHRDTA